MESPLSDAFQSGQTLANSLLEQWGTLASKAASKMDARAYDASSVAEDAIEAATLAAEAGCLWAEWTCDSWAALLGLEGGPNIATSQAFEAPAGATLELEGPLTRGAGPDRLPLSVVSIEPAKLDADQTKFTLCADGTGCRGGTYLGRVKATTEEGSEVVVVWITVP